LPNKAIYLSLLKKFQIYEIYADKEDIVVYVKSGSGQITFPR